MLDKCHTSRSSTPSTQQEIRSGYGWVDYGDGVRHTGARSKHHAIISKALKGGSRLTGFAAAMANRNRATAISTTRGKTIPNLEYVH
jgi:hypothetical protein